MLADLLTQLEASMCYPAHIRMEESGPVVQTVREHCLETACCAREALAGVGLGATGYLAGLLHDCGKETGAFRRYIVDIAQERPVARGSVNHTFAGVRLALELADGSDPMAGVAAEHIAYAIGAHHGLFDAVNPEGDHGFDWRKTKADPTIAEGLANARQSHDLSQLRAQLAEAGREITAFYRKIPDQKERAFYAHLVSRLLLSAVIEGDRRSTAEFSQPELPRPVPATPLLWESCLAHMERKLAAFPKDTPVRRGRGRFSDLCRDFGDKPGGIYRLNMPTGAGKTLSSLRYALAHSRRHHKKHIFFVMPLLAIIDQNAQVIRDYLGREDILLEHHSNLLPAEEGPELDLRELLMENWDSPVIITTLVQLLNTLFSHKTSSIRRFHSLCDSVIVLDEVQTVPANLLSLFNQTIAFLAKNCGATVILCSATQPALEHAQRRLPTVPQEIVPYEGALWAPFRRTHIQPTQAMELEEIANFAAGVLQSTSSLLIVCNKKAQAAKLYDLLQTQEAACFHLSASMCMDHRRRTLAAMEAAKSNGKVLCVSTQIMEAGIDASFGCVIRLQAGMDSVVQAAGRCNRHGESETPVPVYVIRCKGETLGTLAEIKAGRDATGELFESHHEDYTSAEAIADYYRIYYRNQKGNFQDFYCKELETTLYDLLSKNTAYFRGSGYFLNQAYKTAGSHFQVFSEDTVDVVVPYGGGAGEIRELYQDPHSLAGRLERLKPYTISLYRSQQQALDAQGGLTTGPGGILILGPDWYDATLGLVTRREMTFLEV